ncbi:MAG: 50S ribosomal protein L10 [Candidatus Nanohaloarchaea archaeon]|nr:50S ribosomal protein L10 [Candidatus Nanohaloarchaea archaeon]
MQLTRQQKEELVDDLAQRMEDYPVVGMLDMQGLPARQLQEIKKELVGEADITMARKTLIELALEKADRDGIEQLADSDATQPALIFTDKNPFSLFKLIQDKKSSAAASGGETAPSDIVIQAGMTDIAPGPMLGQIQELGAGTSVEDGSIKVENDAVAVEAGETITSEVAEVLNALGMEPLEVGLDLKLVYEDGDVFGRDVLEIDTEAYRQDVEAAVSQAFNLAVNAGYLTSATAPAVVSSATADARNLAINAGILADEVVEDIVRKAAGEAAAVDIELDLDSVDVDRDTAQEDEDEKEEGVEEGEEEAGEDAEADKDDADGEEQAGDGEPDEEETGDEEPDTEGEDPDADDDTDAEETDDNDDTEVN